MIHLGYLQLSKSFHYLLHTDVISLLLTFLAGVVFVHPFSSKNFASIY